MSNTTTSWILELVDHITKPIKDVMKSVSNMDSGLHDVTKSVRFTEKETKTALTNAKQYYTDLEKSINDVEKELKDLERQKKSDSWNEQMEASAAFDKAKERLTRLREALKGAEADVEDLSSQVDQFNAKSEKWTDLAIGINQGLELIQKATDALDFSVDVANLTTEVQRMTDLTGDALDDFVKRSRNIAAIYDENASDIARAANAMTKQNGKSFEENLALIEQGYKRGANANGDFLDQLKEYQPFIKQLGLDQSQAIALIAQAGKKGIFSDKAVDSLKEANLSLREMGQTQVDALAGIGLKPEDIVGKTPYEAIQLITKQMQDATPQARQLILSHIFKGAGEDAGLEFIEGLGSMDLDITKLPSVEQAGAGIKGFFSDISTWAGQTFGNIGIYAQELSPMIQSVAAGIPIMQSLTKATWFQTAATKVATVAQTLWNAALNANPIIRIVTIILALVGAVTLAWKNIDWFRGIIFAAWEAIKGFGMMIKNLVINRIKDLLSGITGIGKALMHFFKGEWSQAWDVGKQAAKDLIGVDSAKQAVDDAKKIGVAAGKGYQKGFEKAEEKNSQNTPEVNSLLQGNNTEENLLGNTTPPGKKGTKGNGLEVGEGAGGIKSITMNLDIKNYFNTDGKTNVKKLAEEIVGHVNDRMRDAVINLG